MKLTEVASQIFESVKNNKPLTSSKWPSEIIIETEFSDLIKRIENYTNGNKTRDKGPAGWEYAFSLFFLINKLYASPLTNGDYEQVQISHKSEVQQEVQNDNKNIVFTLKIDDKSYKTEKYEIAKIKEKMWFGKFAVFHTHPKYFHDRTNYQYTFFSSKDIGSLIIGNFYIMGLVAGSTIWLAVKTQDSRMIDPNLLHQASVVEQREGFEGVEKYVKENFSNSGIIFYTGKVFGKLRRI